MLSRVLQALEFLAAMPGWVSILALMVVGLGAGWLCERLLVRVASWAGQRRLAAWNEVLLLSVRRMPMVWFAAGGVNLGVMFAGYGEPWDGLAGVAVRVIVILSLVVVAMRLATAGINSFSRRATALGISGLAVALALQDTLGNLFAGVQIIMSRQIRPGDYIALADGEEGAVTDIQARNTTIRTFPERNRVLVPNSILASTVVTNYSLPRRRLFITLPVGVAYDSDLERVEAVTLDVAKQVLSDVEGGLTDEAPFVRYEEFSDFSINFLLRVPVQQFTDQFLVRHELVKRLHERYGAEGIEIPFPIRTVYMRGRNRSVGLTAQP